MIFRGRFLFLPFFAVFFVFVFLTPSSEAATCVWTGTAGNGLVSTAANWSSCPSGTPQPTDSIVLNATSNTVNWTDAASSTVASILIDTGFTGTFVVARGSTLTISGTFTQNTATTTLCFSGVGTGLSVNGLNTITGGTFAVGTTSILFSNGGVTMTGGSLTSQSGGRIVNTGNFSIAGPASVSGGGSLEFSGVGNIGGVGTITGGSLLIGTTGSNATTTLVGNVTVSGDCLLAPGLSGQLVLKLSIYTLSCGTLSTNNIFNPSSGLYLYVESGTLNVSGLASFFNHGGVASSTVAFYGGTGTVNFESGVLLSSYPFIPSGKHQVIFHAGDSGSLLIGGDLNIYSLSASLNPVFFYGGGKTITINGAVFADTLSTEGITFDAGTSGALTVSGTSTIFKVEGATTNATTTFNGQSKDLTFTNGVTIQKANNALGEVFFTPSTGLNAYNLTINKPSGSLSLSPVSTITGNVTITAGTLYVNGATTVTGDIANSDTIILNASLKKTASASVSPTSYLLGTDGTISITLTDKNRNTVGTTTQTISVTLSAGSDSEALTLTETGVATGVFTGSVSLGASSSPGANNGTLEVSGPSTLTLSYTDSGDSADSVSVTATVNPPGGGGVPIFFGTNTPLVIGGVTGSGAGSQTGNPPVVPTPPPTPAAPGAPSSATPLLIGPFGFGLTSEQVKVLQQYLAEDKSLYPEGKITGYYGVLTKKAVGLFQERYGLATKKDDFYGLAGPKTRAKMNEVWQKMSNVSTNSSSEAVIESLRAQIKALQEKINLLLSQKTLS